MNGINEIFLANHWQYAESLDNFIQLSPGGVQRSTINEPYSSNYFTMFITTFLDFFLYSTILISSVVSGEYARRKNKSGNASLSRGIQQGLRCNDIGLSSLPIVSKVYYYVYGFVTKNVPFIDETAGSGLPIDEKRCFVT